MIYSINMHTTVYQFWRFVYHHEQSVSIIILCTKFIIHAIILYGYQIVRRSFFMAPVFLAWSNRFRVGVMWVVLGTAVDRHSSLFSLRPPPVIDCTLRQKPTTDRTEYGPETESPATTPDRLQGSNWKTSQRADPGGRNQKQNCCTLDSHDHYCWNLH